MEITITLIIGLLSILAIFKSGGQNTSLLSSESLKNSWLEKQGLTEEEIRIMNYIPNSDQRINYLNYIKNK